MFAAPKRRSRNSALKYAVVAVLFCASCNQQEQLPEEEEGAQPAPAYRQPQSANPTPTPIPFSPLPQNPWPSPSPSLIPQQPILESKGSGGASGLQEMTFRANNNLSSRYKINAPSDWNTGKSYGLHVHLHGDGGGGYTDFPNRETRLNLVGVTIRAPSFGSPQWGRSQGVSHAQYVHELLQNDLLRRYNVRLDRIYFSGVSGGAYFLTGHFIPMFGSFYKSGSLILCGGMAPQVAFANQAFLREFRINWQVTSNERDDIMESVEESVASYRNAFNQVGAGVPINTVQGYQTTGNGGHCEFDGAGYTSGIQMIINQKFATVVKN